MSLVLLGLFLYAPSTPADATAQFNDAVASIRQAEDAIDRWDISTADAICQKLMKRYGTSPGALFLAGRVAFYKGEYEKACSFFNRATHNQEIPESARKFIQMVRSVKALAANFEKTESEHFIFYSLPEDAVLSLYALDTLEKSYENVGADLAYYPTEKVRVEVYPDSDAFAVASTLGRQTVEDSGTIGLCKFNRILITSPRALLRGYPWRDTLCHEFTHFVIMKKTGNRVPIWLHEAIAKYEETRWRSRKGGALAPIAESLLAEGIEANDLVTFKQMHPSLAYLPQERNQLAFAEVVTVVRFLKDRCGADVLPKLLDQIRSCGDTPQAIEKVYGASFEQFEKDWRAWLKQQPFRRIENVVLLKRKFKKGLGKQEDVDEIEIPEEDIRGHVILGDLLRDRDCMDSALIEYGKAAREAKMVSPAILNKIALVHLLRGEFDAAQKPLQKAYAVYPQYATTLVNLGRVFVGEKKDSKAIDFFERAIAVNPFNPEPHSFLLLLYKKRGDEKRSKREEKALRFLMKAKQAKGLAFSTME